MMVEGINLHICLVLELLLGTSYKYGERSLLVLGPPPY
jgi:hypothetical protein